MATNPLYDRLREQSWRRTLTPEEEAQLQAWLAEHPENLAEWQSDASLNEVLDRLPDAPLSSNFTARVMSAVRLESTRETRKTEAGWRGWILRARWLPRFAGASVVAVAVLLSYHHFQSKAEARLERAQVLIAVSQMAPENPDILENFDAIRAMDQTSAAPDEELLKLMQ